MSKNIGKHLKIIIKHKWYVFKLCCKVGEPWRGIVHDLSKFSPTEFNESVKYYTGTRSPITMARADKGFSTSWLHHKGRNKHHIDYWFDIDSKEVALVIPYKYAVEMVCDNISAGMVYAGKNWTQEYQYNYWMRARQNTIVNPKIDNFLVEVFTQVKEYGINKTLTKKNMKDLYKRFCIDDKTKYVCEIKSEWKIVDKKD